MDLGEGIRKAISRITGAGLVDEKAVKELVKELQRALISSDVSVKLVFDLCKRIEERSLKEDPKGTPLREHVLNVVYEELVKFLGDKFVPQVGRKRILLCGLYGAGKTTTAGKLAKFYEKRGLKVALIAGDLQRPAAVEQLRQVAEQVNAGFYSIEAKNKKASEVAASAVEALSKGFDVLVFDSAGRSAFDDELALELREVGSAFAPDEALLVIGADAGQVAGKQAMEFNKAVALTGVIVTRMDGSGKGGGALSAVAATGAKICFLASGEKPEAFEAYDSQKFVSRLLGFPDLPALLEKAKEATSETNLEKVAEEGKLDYAVFLEQLNAMQKLGPLKQVAQMLGMYEIPKEAMEKNEENFKRFAPMIKSMTAEERKKPELMKQKTRQERVARGAGVGVDEVRQLVGNFEKMQKMFNLMKRDRSLLKRLGKMVPGGLGG